MRYLILTLSLILGLATSVSAGSHLPTGGEILQKGKVLYKFPHIDKWSGGQALEKLEVWIMHKEEYYVCWVEPSRANCNRKEIFETSDIWKADD